MDGNEEAFETASASDLFDSLANLSMAESLFPEDELEEKDETEIEDVDAKSGQDYAEQRVTPLERFRKIW